MAPVFHELMNDYMNKNRSRSVSPGAFIHQQGAATAGPTYSPVQTFYHQSHHQLPPNTFYG